MSSHLHRAAGAITIAIGGVLVVGSFHVADARPTIKRAFIDAYPSAEGSRLDDLISNANHCGVCHYDFDGGGPRNPYGLAVEVARDSGVYADDIEAILSLADLDSDSDGFTNEVEITDTVHFGNTPTFPGLTAAALGSVDHVDTSEIEGHLTPSGGSDTTPPTVTVLAPDGGEMVAANTVVSVSWTASDASGVSFVDLFLSDDGGTTFRPVALGVDPVGPYDWFVPNRPGGSNLIRVTAQDAAGNRGSDDSNGVFTIQPLTAGTVPTTLRDFDLPGSQPLTAGTFDDPSVTCVACHGNYDTAVEPWSNWQGSMMGHAMRDPLFLAALAIAEQDAPSSGDLCLRCHTPTGWLEGRSVDTSGSMTTAKDRHSVQCDFCHRMVDPDYEEGVSPAEDEDVLEDLAAIPDYYANGQFVIDPAPIRRGPYADAVASHAFIDSPFFNSSDMCGTCHDVSNPAFVGGGSPGDYVPGAFDAPHPDGNPANMFPVERTFSEWSASEYASTGVYAPEFAGDRPDGMVSTCQDCHMRDVTGEGCNQPGAPTRSDLGLHDLTGGNTFVPDILPLFFPGEVDPVQLADGKARATAMLQLAATLTLAEVAGEGGRALEVTVTNQTGHKLPSGYPEGRRAWVHVVATDELEQVVYESGAYDDATGTLTHDEDLRIYEIEPGISVGLSPVVGHPAGPSFHFVLNDTIWLDTRIPPRGFTNAAFEAIQSPPVGTTYADGQHWDTVLYPMPASATNAVVTVYYQSTSREYIEFLRDENTTNDAGQDLYDAWVASGRSAPVAMVSETIPLGLLAIDDGAPRPGRRFVPSPNPFSKQVQIALTLPGSGMSRVRVYDPASRLVRTVFEGVADAGDLNLSWDGRDQRGERVAPGAYFVRLDAPSFHRVEKVLLVE